MSQSGFRVEIPIDIKGDRRAQKMIARGDAPEDEAVPQAARLLALAWKWESLVRRGETSCGKIARRHGLSRARVSQICALTLLPPERQERILADC